MKDAPSADIEIDDAGATIAACRAFPGPCRVPSDGYPWCWSVVPWFEGTVAATGTLLDPAREARRLGSFLRALHRPAPHDAPINQFQGVPLIERRPLLERNLATLSGLIDGPRVMVLWDEAAALPPWPGPPVWIHGDLHTGNIVTRGGCLSAVIDFGGAGRE